MTDTHTLYNATADRWQRKEPNSLSDYTARPRVFELCGDVTGMKVIDLGAGEGYCAREIARRGAAHITGIELSEEMVSLAIKQQDTNDDVIDYKIGDVTALDQPAGHYDLALGVFVYNYLTAEQTQKSFAQVYKLLKPGSFFVFSVPHPSFPFIKKTLDKPFYFDTAGAGYFSSRNQLCQGEIWCRDGTSLNVQMIPKSLTDYFSALANAGFTQLPELVEMGVDDKMLALDPEFFTPLKDIPLHLAFKIQK